MFRNDASNTFCKRIYVGTAPGGVAAEPRGACVVTPPPATRGIGNQRLRHEGKGGGEERGEEKKEMLEAGALSQAPSKSQDHQQLSGSPHHPS